MMRSRAADITSPHATYRYGLSAAACAVVLLAAGATLTGQIPILAFFMTLAFLFGWTQVGGRCGYSHTNTIGSFKTRHRALWLWTASAYTVSGAFTSSLVGTALAVMGASMTLTSPARWGILLNVAIIFALREGRLVRFPLPQIDRQTVREWAHFAGWKAASVLWGAHIGLAFATVMTYGGLWVLAVYVVGTSSLPAGIGVMLSFWFGRCVPLWAPGIVRDDPLLNSKALCREMRPVHAFGLAVCIVVVTGELVRSIWL